MGGAGAGGYERSEGAAVIKMIYIILTLVSGILLSAIVISINQVAEKNYCFMR